MHVYKLSYVVRRGGLKYFDKQYKFKCYFMKVKVYTGAGVYSVMYKSIRDPHIKTYVGGTT